MSSEKIDTAYIASRLTIESLCRALSIPVPQGGRNIKCPLGNHKDNNPSFTLDDKKGRVLYHCKSCGAGGDGIDLIMTLNRLDKHNKEDFLKGIEIARSIAGLHQEVGRRLPDLVPVGKHEPLPIRRMDVIPKDPHKIIQERRTSDAEIVKKIQDWYMALKGIDLSLYGDHIIYLKDGDFALAMYDETKKVVGYQTGKKKIIAGSKVSCFTMGKLDPNLPLRLTEGVSDYLSALAREASVHRNVIGVCSATTPAKNIVGVVKTYYRDLGGEEIIVCFDYDGVDKDGFLKSVREGFAGAKKAHEVAKILGGRTSLTFASTTEKKDVNDFFRTGGAEAIDRIFTKKFDAIQGEALFGKGDERGNPAMIARSIGKKEHLASENGNLWRYEKGVWNKLLKNEPEKFIKDFLLADMYKLPNTNVIQQVLSHVMYDTSARGRGLLQALSQSEEYFLKNKGVVYFEDCKYNVFTGDRSPYYPDDYVISTLAGTSEFEGVTCPRFHDFLRQIFAGDTDINDRILFIQELFGYCLYPQVPQEKLFAWIGKGGNGKGTLMETLGCLVGADNRKNMNISRMDQGGFALSQLIGKYVNSCSEEQRGVPLSSPALKMLTGGDTITTDRKFSTDLDFKPFCKVIISLNDAPSVTEDADWLGRRLMMLWFNNRFDNWQKGIQGDPNLKGNLRKEIVGIRGWAVEGLRRLLKNGRFTEPESMREQTSRFLQRHDRVMQFYIRKVIPNVSPTKKIFKLETLYMEYRNYHESQTGSSRGVVHFETLVQRISEVSSGIGKVNYSSNELVFDYEAVVKKYRSDSMALGTDGFEFTG